MLHRYIITICAVTLLGACNNGNEDLVGQVNGRDVSRVEFESYLKFKKIPMQDEKRVEAMLSDYMNREAYASIIEKTELVDNALMDIEINEFRKQMLISRYFEAYLDDKVNEEAIRNYYNTHAEDYQVEKIKVAHVLFRTNKKMSEIENQAVLTKAQEAYSKARAGMLFSDVAKQYSEDTISAKQGGDLGWIRNGSIDPVFSDKAFSTQAGEITEPFKTPFGFHIVKVLEEKQTIKTAYEKVKGDIRYQLRQAAKMAELTRLQQSSKITIK